MVRALLATKEVAKYLNINEKQVYQLIKKGKIPATRVTGKWIFPRKLINEWIETKSKENLASTPFPGSLNDYMIILGSNDLSLDYLVARLKERFPESTIFSSNVGSMAGMQAVKEGKAHISGIHLLDSTTGQYNHPYLEGRKVTLVNLAYRDQGIIVSLGNPLNIQGLQDAVSRKARFINRQVGSGTRLLLDSLLRDSNICSTKIQGYKKEVSSHLEVGIEILRGKADFGLGLLSVARYLGLDFIAITKERFDLLISEEYFFTPQIQYLLATLSSRDFRKKAKELGGYDTSDSGTIMQRG
jgi:putative molybdopterin biosynthesis protein